MDNVEELKRRLTSVAEKIDTEAELSAEEYEALKAIRAEPVGGSSYLPRITLIAASLLIASTLFVVFSLTRHAGVAPPETPAVQERGLRELEAIEDSLKAGKLTPAEALKKLDEFAGRHDDESLQEAVKRIRARIQVSSDVTPKD